MCRNNRGFTLIEFLVAIVILLVGMLGLLQSVNIALEHNMLNQLRNEAVAVADEAMSRELAKPFDLVSTTGGTGMSERTVQRRVLTGFKNYSVTRSGVDMDNSKQVTIDVRWHHKRTGYSHTMHGVISRTSL